MKRWTDVLLVASLLTISEDLSLSSNEALQISPIREGGRINFECQGNLELLLTEYYKGRRVVALDLISNIKKLRSVIFTLKDENR